MKRTAVLGLGNPIVADDRVGLAVAQAVARLLDESPVAGVDVLESTRGGLELLDLLTGYERAIVVDCLVTETPQPGRVHRLGLDRVAGSARLVNAHGLGVREVFDLAARLGIAMPQDVEIIGVEAGDITTLSEEMSPPVAAVVEVLAREIHASLAGR